MAYPSPREWHHLHFDRIILTYNGSHTDFRFHAGNRNITPANRYFCSPVIIKVRSRIDKIGVYSNQDNSGNFILGVHDSAALIPVNALCDTGSLPVAASLTPTQWDWFVPTATPTIEAGLYFIGVICNTTFDDGVAGLQIKDCLMQQINSNTWSDGIDGIFREDVGAFAVPNPMTPVIDTPYAILALGLEVTVMP